MYDKFKKDLETLKEKLEDVSYAEALYAALCNIIWVDIKTDKKYSCSWRFAGGLVSKLRNKDEDYLDFYCSGNEGAIRDDILEDMSKLGWKPTTYDDKPIETYKVE